MKPAEQSKEEDTMEQGEFLKKSADVQTEERKDD